MLGPLQMILTSTRASIFTLHSYFETHLDLLSVNLETNQYVIEPLQETDQKHWREYPVVHGECVHENLEISSDRDRIANLIDIYKIKLINHANKLAKNKLI